MSVFTIILYFALIALIVYTIVKAIFDNYYRIDYILKVWKAFSIKMFFECLGVIVLVISASILLNQVSWLSIGYMQLLSDDSGGIVSVAASGNESGSIWLHVGSIVFLVILLVAIPFLAEAEEIMFRKGVLEKKKMIKMSFVFGLVHLVMGITIGTALAISIAGYFFAVKYKKAHTDAYKNSSGANTPYWFRNDWIRLKKAEEKALFMSTVYHSMYNSIIIITAITLSTLLL